VNWKYRTGGDRPFYSLLTVLCLALAVVALLAFLSGDFRNNPRGADWGFSPKTSVPTFAADYSRDKKPGGTVFSGTGLLQDSMNGQINKQQAREAFDNLALQLETPLPTPTAVH
jgi:hypothetical protein